MTVKEKIVEWLKGMGADGLCCEECGCGLDDLSPCGCDSILECVPAKLDGENEDGDILYSEIKEEVR